MTDADEEREREAALPVPKDPPPPATTAPKGAGNAASAADQAVANQERMLETGEENPI